MLCHVGQLSLEAFSFGLALAGGVVVEAGEVVGEDRVAVSSEDSVGVEAGDGVEQVVCGSGPPRLFLRGRQR
ncbi:hypothetical protein [Amycolatopsis sp. NPDC059021]|uniref:hypothetical protein n=1 Tax=Amycolatopsis sp. NPDC059021 TaxID=3346704 RepID=UPI003672940E